MLASEIAAIQRQRLALTASAVQDEALVVPVEPPAAWFDTPETPGPMPLTVQPDGQVYGHLALWGSCHTGHPNRCVQPPSSPSSYRFFHTGAVDTAEGTTVATGRITAETGHPSLTASRASAVRHYDETGFAAADVRARDGQFGIWVAGALRPDATPNQVRALKASVLSGDWRSVNGSLEMIGALAVNVGGFLVPRAEVALAASGDETGGEMVTALVSAGVCYPPDGEEHEKDPEDRRKRARMKALVARGLGSRALINAGLGLTASAIRMQSRPLTAAVVAWESAKHPRHPAGNMEGGQFAPKGAGMSRPVEGVVSPPGQEHPSAYMEHRAALTRGVDPTVALLVGNGATRDEAAIVKAALDGDASQSEAAREVLARVTTHTSHGLTGQRIKNPEQLAEINRAQDVAKDMRDRLADIPVERRYPTEQGGHPKGFGLGPNYRIKTSPGDAPKHSVKERTLDRFGRRRVPGVHGS